VGRQLAGQLTTIRAAALIDVGLEGAQIEHTDSTWPGTLAFLTVGLRGRELTLKCRVVHSALDRYEVSPTGKRTPLYRTGLEFLPISEEARRLLIDYIASLKVQS
jgi:hypothetical protein